MSRTEAMKAHRDALKREAREATRDLKNDTRRTQRMAKRLRGEDDDKVIEVLGLRQIQRAKAAAVKAAAKAKAEAAAKAKAAAKATPDANVPKAPPQRRTR